MRTVTGESNRASTGALDRAPPRRGGRRIPVRSGSNARSQRRGRGAGKGRMGRQKGVECRPFQVTGGHWRTPENVAWPGTIALDQVRRPDPRRGSIPPKLHHHICPDQGICQENDGSKPPAPGRQNRRSTTLSTLRSQWSSTGSLPTETLPHPGRSRKEASPTHRLGV